MKCKAEISAQRLLDIEQKIARAKGEHNKFLKELGLAFASVTGIDG